MASVVALLAAADRVYYPDVMLICGEAAAVERLVRAPSLVAEVTSPSTRATDQREKLEVYLRLPSLRTYLIVDQRRRHVVRHTREGADASWQREESTALDDRIAVPSLGTSFALGELYDGVTLPPMTVREEFDAWVAEEEAMREAEDVRASR